MSTTTATFTQHTATADTAERTPSFFERLIAARTRQGAARVSATFARMSDRQLADIGFTPDQVRQIRATGAIPADYWR